MRNQSDSLPLTISKRQSGYAIVYDLEQKSIDGKNIYEYNEILVPNIDQEIIAHKIIEERYSIPKQIEVMIEYLINGDNEQWANYISYINYAKSLARSMINED